VEKRGVLVCWSTKAAISLKRAKIEETYYGEPIETHQRWFERYHPRPTIWPPVPQDWWFATPKTSVAIISGSGKRYGLKFEIWLMHSQGLSEQKPIQNFGEKGAWAYPGTAQIFLIPLLSQERVKLQKSKFCTHIRRIDRNKSQLKFREK